MILSSQSKVWHFGLDSGAQVDVIYTDFAKAFDTVPRGRLLTKLKSYNISDKLIAWIQDFSVIEYKAYVLTVSFLLGLMYSVAFRKEVF